MDKDNEDTGDEYQEYERASFESLWELLKERGISPEDKELNDALELWSSDVQMLGHMNGV